MKTFRQRFLTEGLEDIDNSMKGNYSWAAGFTIGVLREIMKLITDKKINIEPRLMHDIHKAYNMLEDARVGETIAKQYGESKTTKNNPKFTETTIRKTWIGKRPSVHGDKKYNRNKNKQIPND